MARGGLTAQVAQDQSAKDLLTDWPSTTTGGAQDAQSDQPADLQAVQGPERLSRLLGIRPEPPHWVQILFDAPPQDRQAGTRIL
ncbi:hypothetical protein DRV85_09420 [Rhodosalinus halophilus]|uniref:Uncharacterized protein n=1 Tax=Rhodosalinus halophilus TaxID=2259333 RepID=A0A365UB01_9RHOB|nr:hypothetical protein DRV85_09420 [Rhodosalinus halophilus]